MRLQLDARRRRHSLLVSPTKSPRRKRDRAGGDLTFQPGRSAPVQIGSATIAANRLDLTPAKLALIQPGFRNVTFVAAIARPP